MIFDCQTVLNEEETKKKKKIIRKINDLELRVAIPKIIDFGLARRYENPDGTLRKYRSLKVDFRGTKSFASISVLEGNVSFLSVHFDLGLFKLYFCGILVNRTLEKNQQMLLIFNEKKQASLVGCKSPHTVELKILIYERAFYAVS